MAGLRAVRGVCRSRTVWRSTLAYAAGANIRRPAACLPVAPVRMLVQDPGLTEAAAR